MSAASITRMLLRVLRDASGLLLTLVAGALVFLLFTEAGAQLALRELQARLGMIRAENVGGRLWGPLHAERLVYEDDFVVVELDALSVDWSPLQALRARVAISALQAERLRVVVKPREPAAPTEPSGDALTRLPVDLVLGALRVNQVEVSLPEAEPLRFDAVVLQADWLGERVRLHTLQASTPWVGALTLAGSVRLRADAVEIEALSVAGFVDAQIEGRYGYDAASDLRLRWSALRWPPQGEVQLASEHGSLHWQGLPDDWRFALDGRLQAAGETLQIVADGHGSLAALTLTSARIDSGHGRIDARAKLQYDGLQLDAQGRVEALDPQHYLPQLEGWVQGGFRVQARLAGAAPDLRFELNLDDSRLQGHVADVDATGHWRGEVLTLERFEARAGNNHVRGAGQVLPTLSAQVQIDAAELSALLPELSGRVSARLRADGPLARPRLSGRIDAEQLTYGDYGGEQVQIRFDLDPAQRLELDASLRKLSVGTPIDSAEIDLRGTLADHRLSLAAVLPQGKVTAALAGALDLQARDWAGRIDETRIELAEFAPLVLEAPAALRLRPGRVELEPACLTADAARLCAALRPVDGARRIALRLERLELAMLEPWLGGLKAQGLIEGRGYVDLGESGLDDLRLDLGTSRLRLARAGLPPLTLLPGHLRVIEDGRALLLTAELPLERGGLAASGRLAPGEDLLARALTGELRLDVPELSWLQLLNVELQDTRGRLTGEVRAQGTLAAPRFDGRVGLSEASLRLRTPGIRLDDIEASLTGSSDGVLQVDAHARSGEGALRVDGELNPWREPLGLRLRVHGEDFLALRTPEAQVRITPDLRVELADGELHVSGVIDVPRAEITPKRIGGGVGPSTDQMIVRRGDAASGDGALGIHADVRLRLGEAVRFDGFGLTTRLIGAVRVIERPGVPTSARGELRLIDGRYEAYGQELDVETGKLLFTGGALTQPAVELRATREPREDIIVGVLVRGTLDKPQFSLFSTPAMPQEQQLSWLVLGRSLDGAGSASDRGLVADAALGLGLAGGEWLAQRFGSRIGLDEVTLGAKPGERSEQAQLTVGKYLSPKLFISYGVGLFQPGQSFRLLYDIGRGFKLATETGVESGGDLLYTIER
ncbi:translocation/assembly module TamB domain-containing protein [Sinimarinibacterium thermocellulolyticum]|uniref:Translocation/assembly module TamB domain-containing protein n=1 Tax=Sinimarinibacterium thermocellulolyticum TaxID=3170016 RepID=A0ABV2AC31_9GAMM